MMNVLALCIAGALLELDTTYALQLTFSRGIIAGPLLGLLCGNVLAGLQIGIFTELLFIDINPLGGMLPPSATVCCTLSMALYVLHIPVYFAFFFGVIGAILFSVTEIYLRRQRAGWVARQEQEICRHPGVARRTIAQALLVSGLTNFLFLLCFCVLIGPAFAALVPYLPEQLLLAGKFAFMAVPWIGLATLVSTFRLKTR